MNNKRNISLIVKLSIFLVFALLLISGGTYAFWSWRSDTNKNVGFQTVDGVEDYIIYDAGTSYFVGDFQPKATFCESVSTTLSVAKTEEAKDIELQATIYMDVNAIGSNIAASNSVYWVVTEGESNISCSEGLNSPGVINYGTFNGKDAGDSFALTSNKKIKILTEAKKFTVWIWIDYNGDNISSLTGNTIDANVWTKIDMLDNTSSNKVNAVGDAYAVYSEDDNSLRFYRSETPIGVGSIYNGKTVTAVYTNIEDEPFLSLAGPWDDYEEVITTVVFEDYVYPESIAGWFTEFYNCTSIDVTKLDTSNVTNMDTVFAGAGKNVAALTIIGLENWDTSNVTDMDYMFSGVGAFDIFDTSSVTSWNIGNISGWDVSNVTSMISMFEGAGRNATSWGIGDISSWNVSNVTDMSSMFEGAGRAAEWSLDLSGWNVSNVTDYDYFDLGNEGKIVLPTWGVNSDVYTITYYANGGTGIPASQTKIHNQTVNLSSVVPTHSKYTFNRWEDEDGNIYQPGQAYSVNADLNLYAKYGIYALRYTCDYLGGYDRLSTYFVTECDAGVCSYTKKYGLDNTFDFSLDYSGIPTWSVTESSLCTSALCGNCIADWKMWVGFANVGCYSAASKGSSLVTTLGTGKCSHLLSDISITTYRTYYNGLNYVWFYYSDYNCYIFNGDLTTTCD